MNDENNKKNKTEEITEEKENVEFETAEPARRYFRFVRRKLIIIFIIGVMLGVALKGKFLAKYVIGFEDYKAKQLQSDYDFDLPEPKVEESQNQNQAPAQAQPSCN